MIGFLRNKWGVRYELRLLVKGKSMYLQIMWGYLEQQSFPLSESEYRAMLAEILEVINRLGRACMVRSWLLQVKRKPRVGKALSLPLRVDERSEEFVL
ncbi:MULTISPECIES: DUF3067 family protein [Prochlorococcus]|uniref:DUF3067 family protein n=1 Tax=Prochlorococcus TaxID=1218 RepID=UPI0000DB3EE4|nr:MULTISPECIES: DUF3067 family protein [Prochlorococcus]